MLRDHAGSDCRDSLTPERVVEIISADLHARGIGAPAPADALGDETWINLVHDTYHPPIVVDE